MGLLGLAAIAVIGYFIKDILKVVIIIGIIAFVAIYKLEALPMMYQGIVSVLGYLKGVLG